MNDHIYDNYYSFIVWKDKAEDAVPPIFIITSRRPFERSYPRQRSIRRWPSFSIAQENMVKFSGPHSSRRASAPASR